MIKELEKLFGERVYTVWDVHNITGFSEIKIRRAIKDCIFKGDKRKGRIYIRQNQLDKYLNYLEERIKL